MDEENNPFLASEDIHGAFKSVVLDEVQGPAIKVKVLPKVKFEGATNVYTMQIETNHKDHARSKVTKSY